MPDSLNLRPKGYFGKGSVYISEPERKGESGIRRLAINQDALVTQPAPGVGTIPDIIDYAAREHGNRLAMGYREVIAVHEEEKEVKMMVDGKEETQKKKWKYFELSDYQYINYIELQKRISEVARAFVHLEIGTDEIVEIFSETSLNWQIVSQACGLISTTIATAYDTLGEDGLAHSINEPGCVGIFTNANQLDMLTHVLPNTPSIKYVFYDGSPPVSILKKIQKIRDSNPIHVYHIDALHELGREKPLDILHGRRPSPDTMACVMYTSGSTGKPKGVCLSHGNLVAAVGAMYRVFEPQISAGNRIIAYLPLAHVLEYAVELCAIFAGVTCGYARSKTLGDSSVRKCKGDLAAFKPTIMFGAPAVWEMIRKGVVGSVEKSGWVGQKVFSLALGAKNWLGQVPMVNRVVDYAVLHRVKNLLGGKMMFAVNGGASINRETQDFFNLAVVPMTQGYGLTESCGMCSFLPLEMLGPSTIGVVGLPAPCVEIKLLDCPDMGYFASTDIGDNKKADRNEGASTQNQSNLPQGEICIRGPAVTKGYFKRPDLNDDPNIFMEGGWLRTGDVGQWNEDGTLSIIDRLKNLVKMQSGEYIAIERLESIYKSCKFIANMCVHAAPNATQPVGIIVPHESNLRAALSGEKAKMDLASLCRDGAVRKLVLDECKALARKHRFARMEMLAAVILSDEEWTPSNGMITAAQKLNRAKIAEKFKDQITES